MVEAMNRGSSHWWWLDSHNRRGISSRSPWLQTTLAELDEKANRMLKLIEEDADSFAQRAEMYYKKRPELITMVEDFYRAHRSLAERYDQAKSESGMRLSSPWSSSPLSFTKYRLEKSLSLNEKSYDSYSEANGPDLSDESEVDDPEQEEEVVVVQDCPPESDTEEVSSGLVNEEMMRLREELEKLREENEAQRVQLKQKDEEKREVIRQLSLAMDVLREENLKLRKRVLSNATKRESSLEFNKLKENFLGKLFNGFGKPQANPVAL